MRTSSFTTWVRWPDREQLASLDVPGVYVLARSDSKLAGQAFSWCEDVIYVGMTNSKAGLRGRLQQFDDTIAGKRLRHGGADRVRFRHRHHPKLIAKMYVSVRSVRSEERRVGKECR